MSVDQSNQAQADFWHAAGPLWTELKSRFDAQAGDHGLAAVEALDPQPGERVLDVGCGTGSSTLQIAERVGPGGAVVGLDISDTMVDAARELAAGEGAGNVTYEVGDAMVDTAAGDLDGVYSRFGVMFFSDPTRAFSNLRGALKPGGRLAFVCWKTPAENPWASISISTAAEFVDIPFGGDPTAPGPFSFADPDRVRSILDDAGFSGVSLEPHEFPARIGSDLDEAVSFMARLAPPVAALAQADPDKFTELKAAMAAKFAQFEGPDGVATPSASWIVTAQRG